MTTEKFHWTSSEGVEIVLPHMDKIKAGVFRRHRKEEPIDFIFSVLEEAGDEAAIALVDDLDTDDLNKMFEKWQEGSTPGESSRSST